MLMTIHRRVLIELNSDVDVLMKLMVFLIVGILLLNEVSFLGDCRL